jgi:predicted flap endonuclease-1-like 5' DNA nuclease
MNHAAKNLLRVAGVVVGLGAAVWALRDRMLPGPEIHDEPPPKFRTGGGSDDLTSVKGIGPVYADRLNASGIHSFSDLAGAEAAYVADVAETSVSVAETWVRFADSLT